MKHENQSEIFTWVDPEGQAKRKDGMEDGERTRAITKNGLLCLLFLFVEIYACFITGGVYQAPRSELVFPLKMPFNEGRQNNHSACCDSSVLLFVPQWTVKMIMTRRVSPYVILDGKEIPLKDPIDRNGTSLTCFMKLLSSTSKSMLFRQTKDLIFIIVHSYLASVWQKILWNVLVPLSIINFTSAIEQFLWPSIQWLPSALQLLLWSAHNMKAPNSLG